MSVDVLKGDLLETEHRRLFPFLIGDTNPRLEGEFDALEIAKELSLEGLREHIKVLSKKVRQFSDDSEEEEGGVDSEYVDYFGGVLSELKYIEKKLTEMSVLFQHAR